MTRYGHILGGFVVAMLSSGCVPGGSYIDGVWQKSIRESARDEIGAVGTKEELDSLDYISDDKEIVAYLEAFWQRHDPDPSTTQNEAREEYMRRLDFAKVHYRGFATDRGRVYIRYGRPDEILTLRKADDPRVKEPGTDATNEEQLAELYQQESFARSLRREREIENLEIELWLYYRFSEGQPPPSPFDKFGPQQIKFAFAGSDEFGRMRQVYSTEPHERIDPRIFEWKVE